MTMERETTAGREAEELFEIMGILDAAARKAKEAYAQAQAGQRRVMWREILACELKTDEALFRLNRMVDPDPEGKRPDAPRKEEDEFVVCGRGTLDRMIAAASGR